MSFIQFRCLENIFRFMGFTLQTCWAEECNDTEQTSEKCVSSPAAVKFVFCLIGIDSLSAEQDEECFQIFSYISEKQQCDSTGVIFQQDIHLHDTAVTQKRLPHSPFLLFRSCWKGQQEQMRCTYFIVDSAGYLTRFLFNSEELLSGLSAARA